MIANLRISYRIAYEAARRAKRTADVHEMHPISFPEASSIPKPVIHVVEEIMDRRQHFWFEIDGRLYRRDPMKMEDRLGSGEPFLPPIDGATALEEFEASGVAKSIVASGRAEAIAAAQSFADGVRVHDGVLYYPSAGPVFRLRSAYGDKRPDAPRNQVEVDLDLRHRPAVYGGRCFGLQDLAKVRGFAYDKGWETGGVPSVKVHDDRFANNDLGDFPLLEAAATLFDPRNFNRTLSNVPFHYVDNLLRYHADEIPKDVVTEALIEILVDVVRHPGESDYKNDVRRRYLDALNTVQFLLCMRMGWSPRELSPQHDEIVEKEPCEDLLMLSEAKAETNASSPR